MIGKEKEPGDGFLYNFRLSKRIPNDHPLRKLRKILDLDFLYKELKDKYGRRGNVSVPPPVLMKMMLLLVLYNVRSERELMRTIPLRLDWIWFLGYELDDEIPHHSVLSKARKRWGEEIFRDLFQRILYQAIESGLVDGEKLFVDASLVEADASKNSVKRVSQMELVKGYEEFVSRLDEKKKKSVKRDKDSKKRGGKGGKYSKVNKERSSKTDPDAGIVRTGGKPGLFYKVHRGVDELFEIITSCQTTPGEVNEAHILDNQIDELGQVFGGSPAVVVGDSKYGTKDNFINLKRRGIRTHLKDLTESQEKSGSREGKFKKKDFQYHSDGDCFVCPGGERLDRRSFNSTRRWWEYKAKKECCDGCLLRSQCTEAKGGRTLKRDFDEVLLERGRSEAKSVSGISDLRKRQHLMERSFATGKRYGYKRSRWRGLWRVSIQQYLVATVQNLLKIMKYGCDPAGSYGLYGGYSLKKAVFSIIRKISDLYGILALEYIREY